MSKAEKRAEEYCYSTLVGSSYIKRMAYIQGYHQAEKDNELTWEDVEIIINAFLDFCIENKERGKTKRYNDKEYCKEVLKRFKERKEK